MDKDGKYTLRACNIRLDASKAQGLVEYYTNKQLLSKSILDEKLLFITNHKSFSPSKKKMKIKELEAKYSAIDTDYQNFIDINKEKYTHLISLVSLEGTSVKSAEVQP